MTVLDRGPARISNRGGRVAPRRAVQIKQRMRTLVLPTLFFIALILLWEALSASLHGARKFLLPPPQSVVVHGFLAHQAYHEIIPSFIRTSELATVGLVIAVVLGVLIAAVMYRFAWLERAGLPYLVALQATPILAVAPLLAVAFGYSFFAKVLVVILVALFPIPTSFLLGLRSVEPGAVALFKLAGASRLTQFTKLAVPNALPQLLTGIRISAGLSVIGAIVGEEFFQAGSPGLGMRLLQYLDQVAYNRLYACLILSSLLGIAFYSLFTSISRRLLRAWHSSAIEDR